MRRFSVLKASDNSTEVTSSDATTPIVLEQGNDATDDVVQPVELPPDGGYGWVVAGALSLINFFTWGVAASYGVYISHYLATDYFPGATPLDYALIGGLEFGVAMIISPACTVLTREFGRLSVMLAGIAMFSGGFIAASFAHETWQLYLSQGVLIGLGEWAESTL